MSKRQMFLTKLRRIVRTGLFNFWRDGTITLASVLVMMVTLSVIAFLSFSSAILDTTLTELKNKIDVNVTFITGAKEEDILKIKETLEKLPEVLLVTYVSREEALIAFKERHANDQSILSALDELNENPLGAVLNIQARDPSQYASIAEFLSGDSALTSGNLPIIDNVNYFQNKVAIDKLTAIIATTDRLGLAITIFLAFISVLIAFTTIRLTIYLARDEISVMRLVGASTAYIRGPFVIVGIIYGIVAGFLTLLLILPATYWIADSTLTLFVGFDIFSYYLRHFLEIAFIVLASGIVIGSFSSILATRKYLKV